MAFREAIWFGIGGSSFGIFMLATPTNVLLFLLGFAGSICWLAGFMWLARVLFGSSEH
jgi:hypothetical protein